MIGSKPFWTLRLGKVFVHEFHDAHTDFFAQHDGFAPRNQAAVNHDVALRDGGVLVGQIVNPQGVAKAHANVSIRYANHEVVRTTTDANGVFAAKGLRGGQYQILTDEGMNTCRLWAAGTAPPAARPAALVVSGDPVVRGQYYGGGMMQPRGRSDTAPFHLLKNIPCPVIGFFGKDDQNPSPDDVAKIGGELDKHGKTRTFHSYDGCGHAFQNFLNLENYRPKAARDSWDKMTAWLAKTL